MSLVRPITSCFSFVQSVKTHKELIMRAFLISVLFIVPAMASAGTRTGTLRTANAADSNNQDVVHFDRKLNNGEIQFQLASAKHSTLSAQTYRAANSDFAARDIAIVRALVQSKIDQKAGKNGWVPVTPVASLENHVLNTANRL